MRLYDRWQMALQSPLGALLLVLLVFLLVLGAIYWILMTNQRKRDLLAYLYHHFYEKAEAVVSGFTFIGKHKADFFGRETVVKFSDGSYGICLIPPPELAEKDICDRFSRFYRLAALQKFEKIGRYLWVCSDRAFVIVKGDLLHQDRGFLTNLHHGLRDIRFSQTDKEEILIQLARCLGSLHNLKTDAGEALYHGLLLPRSIYIDFDSQRRITRIVLADSGLAFAVGADKIFQRLEKLRKGSLEMEKYCAQEMIDQLPLLAPEQKDASKLSFVGPKVDIFAFGTLAVLMFTGQRLMQIPTIQWNSVPRRWQSFLKACLEEDPQKRPQDFFEIEEVLLEPELTLTSLHESGLNFPVNEHHLKKESYSLKHSLDRLHEAQSLLSYSTTKGQDQRMILEKNLEAAFKGVRGSKWTEAKKALKEVLKIDSEHAEAHVNMAIVCYELEDLKSSEHHYQLAKKLNPLIAKRFREHIAFKV